jgi:predicted permease
MSLPLPKDAWEFTVNSTYQDVMKTFMSLVTASLVLPLFLIRNFVRVPEGRPIADHLRPSAYWSWALLFLSLVCCMVFFWVSAKYVKVLSGGTETWQGDLVSSATFENLRDLSASGSVLFFFAGLLTLGWFFVHIGRD